MYRSVASSSSKGNENVEHKCSNPNCEQTMFVRFNADLGALKCPHCDFSQ
jgi:hypothetical protein